MDLSLSKQDLAIQARAKAFAEKHLFPHEIATDERKLAKKTLVEIRKQAIAHKLNAYNHTKEDGGHGYTPLQQALICEELGKATCGLWTVVFKASTP
ncbi:MAG TPA: acyl-CoA dehydrogenase family protein, partial [Candidatus Binatia bacterium]|nr:acyl-CoA dehydrogenase family protein [Candidatus Binatia bacterium]